MQLLHLKQHLVWHEFHFDLCRISVDKFVEIACKRVVIARCLN